jgi:hypothetical protein
MWLIITNLSLVTLQRVPPCQLSLW